MITITKETATRSIVKKLSTIFKKAVKLLDRQSELGLPTNKVNIRVLIVEDYSIFYGVRPNSIDITTIWDNRQNPEKLLLK